MDPLVTIVVVPRERFSQSINSLENIYENTPPPFKLIYVDGNSPAHIKSCLEAKAKQKAFQLIRTEHFLTSNQAHNMGLAHVTTRYVVFIDNDIFVAPNWLEKLVQCAEETGAWVVGPLYLGGKLEDQIIHFAGGTLHFSERNGQRALHCTCPLAGQKLSEVRQQLHCEPTEAIEFHCVLVRNESFKKLGLFDETMMSHSDHNDFSLLVRAGGGSVWFEPASVLAYYYTAPLTWSDLPYFFWRWSDAFGKISTDSFRKKWNLPANDPYITGISRYSRWHRRRAVSLWLPGQPRGLLRKVRLAVAYLQEFILNGFYKLIQSRY